MDLTKSLILPAGTVLCTFQFNFRSVMRRLVEIPRLGIRLKLFLTILTWKDGARKFYEKVQILEDAGWSYILQFPYFVFHLTVDELQSEQCKRHLIQIFAWMLAIGCVISSC